MIFFPKTQCFIFTIHQKQGENLLKQKKALVILELPEKFPAHRHKISTGLWDLQNSVPETLEEQETIRPGFSQSQIASPIISSACSEVIQRQDRINSGKGTS